MKRARLHWTLHPEKSKGLYYDEAGRPRSEWYDHEIESKQMSPSAVARELDISYELSVEGVVYNEFRDSHILKAKFEVNPHLPVIRYLDYGRVCACLFSQKDKMGRITFFYEIVLSNSSTHELASAVQSYSGNLGRDVEFKDYDDPSGSYKDHRSKTTDVEIVETYGIYPTHFVSGSNSNRRTDRTALTKQKLSHRVDGEECVQVSQNGCPTLIDAFQSGYRYKEDYSGNLTDIIVEIHPYEDVIDCAAGTILEEFNVQDSGFSSGVRARRANKYTG